MKNFYLKTSLLLLCFCLFSCQNKVKNHEEQKDTIIVGAELTDEYYPLIKNKRVAILSNHTGMVGDVHLLDKLISDSINVVAIFSPEHGFRGDADAGEVVNNSADTKTGVPIHSLYGERDKPSKESMDSFDILLFDIQDVGLRFYTYYVTMARLMDACAEFNKKMIVLDRPNPNGHYVDGPILDMKYKSDVGWLPIPVVHGMTLAELAIMINGEKWLPDGRKCDLTVVKCKNYTHQTLYELPLDPSPNLKSMQSIYLYPSTCLFEATVMSLGRGTNFPFEVYGHPDMKNCEFSFTPQSMPGAKEPPLWGKKCFGVDLRSISHEEIFAKGFDLSYIIDAYNNLAIGKEFFGWGLERLVGVSYIREMINEGKPADEIKLMWKDDVENFKKQRKPYLLYEE
jgi:uncharacterized protein YbbC (DUF1343 family)